MLLPLTFKLLSAELYTRYISYRSVSQTGKKSSEEGELSFPCDYVKTVPAVVSRHVFLPYHSSRYSCLSVRTNGVWNTVKKRTTNATQAGKGSILRYSEQIRDRQQLMVTMHVGHVSVSCQQYHARLCMRVRLRATPFARELVILNSDSNSNNNICYYCRWQDADRETNKTWTMEKPLLFKKRFS